MRKYRLRIFIITLYKVHYLAVLNMNMALTRGEPALETLLLFVLLIPARSYLFPFPVLPVQLSLFSF